MTATSKYLRWAAVAVAVLFCLFPFLWMFIVSLKRQVDIFAGPTLIPQHPTLGNYSALFTQYHMGSYLLNSIIVVGVSVIASLLVGTPAAYALARFRLPGGLNDHALFAALVVRMVPPILLVVPFYIILARLGLLNTRLGLILIYTGINTSFVIWMMQSFLAEIPSDIEDAALVDGDSRMSALRRIILPVASSGLATTAIFAVIATYNDFLIALTMTSTPSAQTVPVGISTLIGKIQVEWGPMAAGGIVGALPILIFAFIVQRHFVRGMTLG
ncbi:MAG: carbohydrate ABC transporter permease, partial [Actinomycetota bacterium]